MHNSAAKVLMRTEYTYQNPITQISFDQIRFHALIYSPSFISGLLHHSGAMAAPTTIVVFDSAERCYGATQAFGNNVLCLKGPYHCFCECSTTNNTTWKFEKVESSISSWKLFNSTLNNHQHKNVHL